MTPQHAPRRGTRPGWARWGLLLCCVVMLAPVAILLFAGSSLSGFAGNLWIVLPLAACLGLHFSMHRGAGRSCHAPDPAGDRDVGDPPKA